MIQISEPVIEYVVKRGRHPSAWKASFKMWDDSVPINMVMDMEIGAPTEERLQEKIKHLKETGIILRG